MKEAVAISDEPIGSSGNGAVAGPAAIPRDDLVLRVGRLEDAVAVLQDTKPLEERIVDRVSKRLKKTLSAPPDESSPSIIQSGRRLLPTAIAVLNTRADLVQQPSTPGSRARARWILLEIYAEARTMVRMYFDPRYRPTWIARLAPPVLLGLILTSWIWLPGLTFIFSSVATVVDKCVDLVLAFVAFKILSREAERYRQTIASQSLLPAPPPPS